MQASQLCSIVMTLIAIASNAFTKLLSYYSLEQNIPPLYVSYISFTILLKNNNNKKRCTNFPLWISLSRRVKLNTRSVLNP